MSLTLTLGVRCPQVNVEDVKILTFANLDIDLKASPRLQKFTGKIIGLGRGDRKTTENRIPIWPSPQLSRLTEPALIAQFLGQVTCLARLFSRCSMVDDFLQRDNVRIDLLQDPRNPGRQDSLIPTSTAMNVVSNHS